jgi:hypothetical protein
MSYNLRQLFLDSAKFNYELPYKIGTFDIYIATLNYLFESFGKTKSKSKNGFLLYFLSAYQ